MSERELFSFRNPYFSVSVGMTLAILVLTVIAGFLMLPYAQTGLKFTDAWDAICHGPTGISRADSPNLAGQYAAVIYKELLDFRSGARTNATMSPFAANLSEQDIADLAAYYAYLPRLPAYHPEPQLPRPRIVINGAPVRGIAPCGACHGSLDNKTGSPWLEGQ